MAFFKNFWDLAASTTYSSHVVGAFDRNTTTGGGIFRWVSGVNNATITNIPGVRIKPTNSLTGYWLRSFDGPISVSWFGCQNSVGIPNTYAQLGVSQLQLDSWYGPGFATTSDNYDTTAIRYAMKFIDDMIALNANPNAGTGLPVNANSLTFEPKTYHLTRSIDLPKGSSASSSPFVTNYSSIIIDGNGATIKAANNNQFDFFVRYPNDNIEANEMGFIGIVFKNFVADGARGVWQGSGYSFLMLGATNNSSIQNITLERFDIGIRVEGSVSVSIQDIIIRDAATNGILCKEGGWLGAYAYGCSNLKLSNITINNFTLGQSECIKIISGFDIEVEHVILSASTAFGHGIYYDSNPQTPNPDYNNTRCISIHDVNFSNTLVNQTSPAVGWTNALITIKTAYNSRYIVDSLFIDNNNSVSVSPAAILNVEAYAGVPGMKPVVELRNINVLSRYPTTPTLPVTLTPSPGIAGSFVMFRNVGDNVWNFQTVDFGGDPTVTPAEIVDPANNLWVTIAPATIPALDELVYVNPVQACCGIQEVLIASKAIDNGLLFIGTDAGESNTGASDVIGLGSDAAGANTGIDVVALGNSAALGNTGSDVVAIGNTALSGNTASDAIGIGENAGQNQTGADATLIGQGAGFNNTGIEVVAIGKSAGNANTGDKLHAIGVLAGAGNTGDYVVAVGSGAAQTNTVNYVIALGNGAGANNAIPNSTIISNDCLPSYLNYTAASTAISGPGATPGTYLYHDQTTNSIGAVRIP